MPNHYNLQGPLIQQLKIVMRDTYWSIFKHYIIQVLHNKTQIHHTPPYYMLDCSMSLSGALCSRVERRIVGSTLFKSVFVTELGKGISGGLVAADDTDSPLKICSLDSSFDLLSNN